MIVLLVLDFEALYHNNSFDRFDPMFLKKKNQFLGKLWLFERRLQMVGLDQVFWKSSFARTNAWMNCFVGLDGFWDLHASIRELQKTTHA